MSETSTLPTRIVAILGNKGGTGKTTLAHLLGVGFTSRTFHGQRLNAAVLMTDPSREPVAQPGRR
ncbi:MAG: hypothetical protein U1F76_28865 [Candidatus Competibacteraceae bacterium]